MRLDYHDARAALQGCYLAVWQNGAWFDPTRASPITWLVRIARNKAIDRLRKRRFKTLTGMFSNEEDYPDAALDPEESLNADQRRALVNASVDALDLAQAALVLAIYRERLTYSQLAARAGLPVTTVKIKVRRALLGMRTQLEDRTQTPSQFLT